MVNYIRLLSYDNACKVIQFVEQTDKKAYANIVVGGVKIESNEDTLVEVLVFLDSLNVPYEMGKESPEAIRQRIVVDLKNNTYRYKE